MNLSEALIIARAAYPIKEIIPSTTLCVSNLFRKKINASYNKAGYQKSHQLDGAFLEYNCTDKNKGQSMYIWPKLILQAYTTDKKAKQYNIKNGLFYEIVEIIENIIIFKNSNDELMQLPKLEIPKKCGCVTPGPIINIKR